jgi:CRP-like cAMP-binding protein
MEMPHWYVIFAYLAVFSSVVTCYMKTMVPLRVVSMICNSCFIIYGVFGSIYPTLLLNAILLPINGWRLYEMKRLIAEVDEAASSDLSLEWLKPYMSKRRHRAGDVLFEKGEVASAMYYSVSGRYRLREMGIEIGPTQVFGELGLLAPDNKRTATLECVEAGEVLVATYDQVKQLYYQNPEFGFSFLRLTSGRLFQNIARMEEELARKNAMLEARAG